MSEKKRPQSSSHNLSTSSPVRLLQRPTSSRFLSPLKLLERHLLSGTVSQTPPPRTIMSASTRNPNRLMLMFDQSNVNSVAPPRPQSSPQPPPPPCTTTSPTKKLQFSDDPSVTFSNLDIDGQTPPPRPLQRSASTMSFAHKSMLNTSGVWQNNNTNNSSNSVTTSPQRQRDDTTFLRRPTARAPAQLAKPLPPRLMRLLRAFGHTIGLGMLMVIRGQQHRSKAAVDVDASAKTLGYMVRSDTLNPDRLKEGEHFTIFRAFVEGSACYLSLHPSSIHKWIIRLLSQEESQFADESFPVSSSSQDDTLLICRGPRPITLVEIRMMTKTSPEYVPVKDFTRLLLLSDSAFVNYCSDGVTDKDLNTPFEIGTVPLSGSQELMCLPQEIQTEVINIAFRTLQKFWYPKIMLAAQIRWRKKLTFDGLKTCPPATLEVIQRQPMFRLWPQGLVLEIIESLSLISFSQGEFIIHEDERSGSGIFFLMQGQVAVLKKMSKKKSLGPGNTKKLVELSPPVCFGEFAFLTEEPRMASVRANTNVDLWVLKKHDFYRIFSRLSKSIMNTVVSVAFEKRVSAMHTAHPMTHELLRSFPIFRMCSDQILDQIRGNLRPIAVPKKYTLYREGEIGSNMYFLRVGKCNVYKDIPTTRGGPLETHIKTLHAVDLLGEDAVLYNTAYSVTVSTATGCDLWVLSKESFDFVMTGAPPQLFLRIMAEAQNQRCEKLSRQQMRFKELVERIPIVSQMQLSQTAFRDLTFEFEAKVYRPREIICSTAHYADRIILLTKGRMKVGDPGNREMAHCGDFMIGECVGYTCVIPHRWSTVVMTMDIVEVLELSVEKYEAFLKKHHVYSKVQRMCQALLFPRSVSPEESLTALSYIADCKTPILFPISLSAEMNVHEQMFGPRGPSLGAISSKARVDVPQFIVRQKQNDVRPKSSTRIHGTALWVPKVNTYAEKLAKAKQLSKKVKVTPTTT
eukprot:PhF_6_TR30131/c0_g1_i1/m.44062